MLALQRTVGNAAVSAMLQGFQDRGDGSRHVSPPRPENVQRSPVHNVLRSPGQPLAEPVRADLEARLNADFSDVRVHTDAAAHESAVSVQAHAYTSGSHVVFQRGRYDTSSAAGRRMLAHELTHVVQQRNGPVEGTPTAEGYSLSHPDDRDERVAEQTAIAAVSGPAPDQNLQRRTKPSARGQRPAAGEAGQIVQRRVGFEFEDNTWRPWRRIRAEHGTMRRFRNIVPAIDDDQVSPVERHAVLHNGTDFRLEADDTPGPLVSNIEFVTEPFEETPAGMAALDRALAEMKAIMVRLRAFTGRPGPTVVEGGPPYPLPVRDYKEHFVRHEQHGLSGSGGLVARDTLLSGGSRDGRFKMQATSGVPLTDLSAVMERLGRDVPGETPQQTQERRADRATIYPPDDSPEFLRVQGRAPNLARQVVAQMQQDPNYATALAASTGELTGFLAAVMLSMKLLRRPPGRNLGVKARLPLMPRNSFAQMFGALPAAQQDAIRNDPLVLVNAVLAVSNANPLLQGGGDQGLAPASALIAPNPGRVTGVDQHGAPVRAPSAAFEQALATVTIQDWLTGIPAGQDYLLPQHMQQWLASRPGVSDQAQGEAVEALESFGSAGTPDTRDGGTTLPLFENRAISPRTDRNNLTIDQAATNARFLLDFFTRIRNGQ
ncbi:DUF4157 domain-containing protein [Frankia sp. CiP3]|uniref:eCIS core domain-containing protein n=1 Tax=Frankia sp. CiP3 TaxID=2880971 RepID=UPI001EF51865|nr:DUF4157 domain-containing protein [Frankia sp. CiP3]